jgi:hypothetical protein
MAVQNSSKEKAITTMGTKDHQGNTTDVPDYGSERRIRSPQPGGGGRYHAYLNPSLEIWASTLK